ncbi:MAG: hypothetical protein LBT43_12155 [Prevotella sp.]|jgi:hypothetical protein|nr:hypothetical protein [Prevotella sp.]
MVVPQSLIELSNRIRGAKLYHNIHMGCRVYIPYTLDYSPFRVRIKAYFEVVNDRLRLNVDVSSNDYTPSWCRQEAVRIRLILEEQFHEIIFDCELIYRNIPLATRLRDELIPTVENYGNALRFLCSMKVSILLSGRWRDKWFLSLSLAWIRYRNNRIDKLYLFLPNVQVPILKKEMERLWPGISLPVSLIPVESLSFNIQAYERLLKSVDTRTMLVIDDCHLFKSPDAIRSRRMMDIADQCNYKLLMTESLIVNNIHDIYMQYRILNKDILGYYRWDDFSRKHIIYGGVDGKQILGYKNLSYLIGLTEPYTYSVNEKEVPEAVPDVRTYICELTPTQKESYRRKKNELLLLIEKYEIQVYDIFRIMGEMERIACGYISTDHKRDYYYNTNKLLLLKEHTYKECRYVIFCKYLFEVDLLTSFWGRKSCAVFCGRNRSDRRTERTQFMRNNKQYLISTLGIQETCLEGVGAQCEIIFFSLSFRYRNYRRELAYIRENDKNRDTPVKRFITNSGIDRKIVEALSRKEKLANHVNRLFTDRQKLREFVESL